MRGLLISFVFMLSFLAIVVFGPQSNPENSDWDHHHDDAAAAVVVPSTSSDGPHLSAPMASARTLSLVVAENGTIFSVDDISGQILWSFPSGSPIYSAYRALPEVNVGETNKATIDAANYYIDVGDDWQLYAHLNGLGKVVKLPSAEELLRMTPVVSSDIGVLLGSKTTTVFYVNMENGKFVDSFCSDKLAVAENRHGHDNPILVRKHTELPSGVKSDAVAKTLYLTRKDYAFEFTSEKTGKVLWNLTFAEIEASFQCKGIDNFLGKFLHEENGISLRQDTDSKFQVHCPASPAVLRLRNRGWFAIPALGTVPVLAIVENNLGFPPHNESESLLALPTGESQHNESESLLALPTGESQHDESESLLALPTGESHNESVSLLALRTGNDEITTSWGSGSSAGSRSRAFVLCGGFVLLIVAFLSCIVFKKQGRLSKKGDKTNAQAITIKKKKSRKSVMNNKSASSEKKKDFSQNGIAETSSFLSDFEATKRSLLPDMSNIPDGFRDARNIGRLVVSSKEIAKGSNGTVVLEGICDGRPVAVKRLVKTHLDVASKEIQNLIASDHHPNIVRWFGVEYDQDFVYLALERCTCSLHDLILSYSISKDQSIHQERDLNSARDQSIQLQLLLGNNNEFEMVKADGHPSPQMLKLMRDVVRGLAHLHELGIIHRDLKPQNVLVNKENVLCAKLSDMGISKRLSGDTSSLSRQATGYGSSGWQAPEQLLHERQTRAVDLFSLGCLFFFCITGGKHPFGDDIERDMNIVNNQKDLFLIENLPEATDLISSLLHPKPELRPKASQVICHPFFWDADKRLSFLRDASDRVELEDREKDSELLLALESTGSVAFGGKWDEKIDAAFLSDVGRYRRYKYDSVRDLLRVIRNKLNHYRELPKEIQGILGQVPEGYDSYFSRRFPKLLIEVYKVICLYCAEEETFRKYFIYSEI